MIGQLHELICYAHHMSGQPSAIFSFSFELNALALWLGEYKVFNFMSVKGLLVSLNLIYRYKADKWFPRGQIARAKQKKIPFIP